MTVKQTGREYHNRILDTCSLLNVGFLTNRVCCRSGHKSAKYKLIFLGSQLYLVQISSSCGTSKSLSGWPSLVQETTFVVSFLVRKIKFPSTFAQATFWEVVHQQARLLQVLVSDLTTVVVGTRSATTGSVMGTHICLQN